MMVLVNEKINTQSLPHVMQKMNPETDEVDAELTGAKPAGHRMEHCRIQHVNWCGRL